MSDGAIKNRLSLWLRSEQALGLAAVAGVRVGSQPPPPPSSPVIVKPDTSAPVAMAQPARPTAPPRESSPPKSTDLFGAEQSSDGRHVPASSSLSVIDEPFAPAELSPDDKARSLRELNESSVMNCVKCGLHSTRTMTVFGEGNADADLAFVGEGPGRDEDASGRPFVGRAGQKLDEMIRAMGLRREQVYICNIVKCRAHLPGPPPKDRPPSDEEVAACSPYLIRQLDIVRPRVIVTLGLPSTRFLLKSKESMTRMRGKWHNWRGIKVMPTWHPAYVLRNYTAQTRAEVWDDLKKVMAELNLPIPKRSGKQD
jgi:DNA polymerase